MKRCIVDSNEIIIQCQSSFNSHREELEIAVFHGKPFTVRYISIEMKFSIDLLSCKKEEKRKQGTVP